MATFNKFNCLVVDVGLKLHNWDTDTFKVYLTNTAPVATNTAFGTPAEITAGNGYTAGGIDILSTYTETPAGTGTFVATDATWTATGAVGPFRYAVIYNDTAAGNNLVGWADYGSSISLANTETFTVDFGANLFTVV